MSEKVLRIGVIQGVNVIEERLVRTRGPVSFGTAPGNTFVLQGSDLPRSVTVFEVKGDKYYLAFGSEQSGQIERHPGQGERLNDLAPSAEKAGDKYRVPLDETARGRVKLSAEITVLFHFVPAPPPAPPPELPVNLKGGFVGQIEPIFTAVLLASFLLHAAFGIIIKVSAPPKPPEIEDLRKIVETIAPPKVEAPKVPLPAENTVKIGTAKEPEKGGGGAAEGGGGDKHAKAKGGGGGIGNRAALRDAIAGRGILQLIGGRGGGGAGGGAVGSVFGSGSAVSDDIGSALAGTTGVGIASGGGGGVTRRGEGGGGGGCGGGCGGAADIGALATGGGGKVDTGEKHAARVVARMRSGDVEAVDGKVDKKGVAAVIRRRQDAFQACYEEALKANSKLQGKLVVEFTIGARGRVTDARVVKDGLGSAAVSSCVVALLKRVRFPAPSDGEVTIQNSFIFQPGGG